MIEQLDDFRIIRKIAEGGMGTVYLAMQESLQREVAVKVLKQSYTNDEAFVGRFLREARSAAQLVHPNIIQIHYVGTAEDIRYFAMEYVNGQDLKDYLRARIRLSVVESLDIIIKVADALALAAEHNIIHRDIKPENIMITPEGHVKVTDFGLAKCLLSGSTNITQPGRILGTVNYMAPEQGLGQGMDSRSDIYSLGTVFFELLSGRPPFKGDHPTSVIYMHVYEPPPPVRFYNKGVPEEIEALILRMMAKKPEERPQTPRELIDELEAVREQCGLHPARSSGRVSRVDDTVHQEAVAQHAPRCLIVDDDASITDLCSLVVGRTGCSTLVAHDGEEGLDLWRRVKPELILLDLNMPTLGGMAVLEERRNGNLPGKVLVVTARGDWETIRRAAEQHIDGYLLKPFSPKVLEERVRTLLELPVTET